MCACVHRQTGLEAATEPIYSCCGQYHDLISYIKLSPSICDSRLAGRVFRKAVSVCRYQSVSEDGTSEQQKLWWYGHGDTVLSYLLAIVAVYGPEQTSPHSLAKNYSQLNHEQIELMGTVVRLTSTAGSLALKQLNTRSSLTSDLPPVRQVADAD